MDQDGCFATPETSCSPYTNAPNHYNACPTGGDLPFATKMTLRSGVQPCTGLWNLNGPYQKNMFPEVAMMKAIESGFGVPQFSTDITDAPLDGGPCPDGTKAGHVRIPRASHTRVLSRLESHKLVN